MDTYGGHHDYSLHLFDMNSADHSFIESLYYPRSSSRFLYGYGYNDPMMSRAAIASPSVSENSEGNRNRKSSPPKHRHDGTSPLPLGMDWSRPPRIWDGQNSVWPRGSHLGWSYCVTVPSWTVVSKTSGSDSVVFYRVQVGIQSPEGITCIRGILRRYSDFLKFSSDLKKEFPMKKLPPSPPKGILRLKSKELMEERRCSLEVWMEKLLSDIDISRSFPVATFLELEAAARSSFHECYDNGTDVNSAFSMVQSDLTPSASSLVAGTSFVSDSGNDSAYGTPELGTPSHESSIHSEVGIDEAKFDQDLTNPARSSCQGTYSRNEVVSPSQEFVLVGQEKSYKDDNLLRSKDNSIHKCRADTDTSQIISCFGGEITVSSGKESFMFDSNVKRLSQDNLGNDIMSSGRLELPESVDDLSAISDLQLHHNLSMVLPTDEQQKINRVLTTMHLRLATARTDIEDLVARLNQELAVRQYLSTKVKDLETELETTKQSKEESLQQAVISERERATQMQWDMEELRRCCLEMELKLKHEQEESGLLKSVEASTIRQNESLLQELEVAKARAGHLLKHHEESELKSRSDIKILGKEIKALRSSQAELKEEITRLTNEKAELERILQEERQRRDFSCASNAKLLHEYEILRGRLEECSVNFLVEEEDKLIMNTSSPSEATDILTTSDNRIALLLAEAQLFARDTENAVGTSSIDDQNATTREDEVRKMLAHVFIDNASLRKQINSIIRYALTGPENSETDKDDAAPRGSVLSKFLGS